MGLQLGLSLVDLSHSFYDIRKLFGKQIELENIILSEVTHAQKDKDEM